MPMNVDDWLDSYCLTVAHNETFLKKNYLIYPVKARKKLTDKAFVFHHVNSTNGQLAKVIM